MGSIIVNAQQTTINIQINSTSNNSVSATWPLNSAYFPAVLQPKFVPKPGLFTFNKDLQKNGLLVIDYGRKHFAMVVQPNRTYEVAIIQASMCLFKDLVKTFWGGPSYMIPRYLLLKDGKMVEADVLRPGDGPKLFEQITKYL